MMWRRLSPHRRPVAVQALRMTVASLASFGLVSLFGLPQGFWAVITALIVTQSNVGGSLKAAFERFMGSVCGAVYGGAVALTIPHDSTLLRAVALVVAVAPLSVLAASSAGFRIAPITAIIVLLGTATSTLGPLGFAIDRILEVGLGCLVGLLASLLIMPARASHAVLDSAACVAQLLARQLGTLTSADAHAPADLAALVAATRRELTALETLLGEAARERQSRLAQGPDPAPLLRTLLRLRHDVVMLRRTADSPWHEAVRDQLVQPWTEAVQAGAGRLERLGSALSERQVPGTAADMSVRLEAYKGALEEVRRQHLTRSLPTDETERLFGIGFVLDQFQRNLNDLDDRVRELLAGHGQDAER
jgi:uncharacterized membrane protein YccC